MIVLLHGFRVAPRLGAIIRVSVIEDMFGRIKIGCFLRPTSFHSTVAAVTIHCHRIKLVGIHVLLRKMQLKHSLYFCVVLYNTNQQRGKDRHERRFLFSNDMSPVMLGQVRSECNHWSLSTLLRSLWVELKLGNWLLNIIGGRGKLILYEYCKLPQLVK